MLGWVRRQREKLLLRDEAYGFLFDADRSGELVSLDTETTGLDPWVDDILSIAAVKIRGNTIVASDRLEVLVRPTQTDGLGGVTIHQLRPMDVAQGLEIREALDRLLRFVGGRPLVGYYLEFDINMINKYLLEWLGIKLPNRAIEVSRLYYDYKYNRDRLNSYPGRIIDLKFDTIMEELDLPSRHQHDAFNDALMAAMMYIKLQYLKDT